MIHRRFVNLVVHDYTTGARSLHQLGVAKHLFYPSTAWAEAASAKNKAKEINSGGSNKLPRRIGSRLLRQLPPPTMCLQRFPDANTGSPPHETFAFLGGSDDGRILHASEGGQVLLYDADAGSTATLPELAFAQPKGLRQPLFISIADAGAGSDKHKERLYVITDHHEWNHKRHNFEVLDLSQLPHSRWGHLPPPMFITRSTPTCCAVKSFAVRAHHLHVDVVQEEHVLLRQFDTISRDWWHAGDWKLPFQVRAEYVPELHSWLGSSRGWWHAGDSRLPFHGRSEYVSQLRRWPGSRCFDDLCSSSDLSVISSAMDARGAAGAAAPKLQHVWQDTNP